jgi:protein involved in polysaccharide export with SLBB domain
MTGCGVHYTRTAAPVDRICVSGEVRHPGTFSDKEIKSVNSAISAAGGFTERALQNRVFVFRKDGRLIVVNATKILKDRSRDVQVFPGDEVQVAKRPWL